MISVVIPLYNKRSTILRALNSVITQTVQPEEIIVVNDGSTDGSEIIVDQLNHHLIRLIHQPNTGVSNARNRGIEEAKGDWIAFLDADDEWFPEFLESIINLHIEFPSCNVLATSYKICEENGFEKSIRLRKVKLECKGVLENYFEVLAFSDPPICSSATVVRRESLRKIGKFPEGIGSGEDLITWAKLAVSNKIAYNLKALSIFWQTSYSVSRKPELPDFVGNEYIRLSKTKPTEKKWILRNKAKWHRMRCIGYIKFNERAKAFYEICKSIKYDFFSRSWIYIPIIFIGNNFGNRLISWLKSKR